MRLQDKVAIITGASQGIGEATARRFAQEGAKVVLAARRREQLQSIVDDIEAAGGTAMAQAVDITDEAAVKDLVAATVAAYGRLDIVVNNAVLMVPGMLAGHDTKAWRQNFIVSLDGAMFLMREAYPELCKAGGAVVNVSSVCGLKGSPATAGYSAAKAAMLGLSRNAAIEWGGQVRVNTVIPGAFLTPPTAAVIPDDAAREATAKSIPCKRIGDPVECANAILFLASDEASYITGAELVVDGGRTAELNTGTASWD
ncbi:SDR family NAD(P)-dependent oxidoreductase [Parahaliea mediterranea]|uniref:SDR family oxidoreductase n=1 Tax=Parahaliea mediterranea TaxID=651086 RepID=A0A939ILP5_9GAMM|nr:SDR family oxidoreductase [Parahaliea mediterranea]MBN7796710.1 SDR family oxidoreductase [Parahaliea mediterranea]